MVLILWFVVSSAKKMAVSRKVKMASGTAENYNILDVDRNPAVERQEPSCEETGTQL